MSEVSKQAVLQEFQQIPGVGQRIAQDLWDLNFRSVQELAQQDPEVMYYQLCAQQGRQVDRCMLYVFRCAVYYASTQQHNPDLLKWWNWKDDLLHNPGQSHQNFRKENRTRIERIERINL